MKLYTRKETAEILGISLSTLDTLKREKKIGCLQPGSNCKVQFTEAHISAYIKRIERECRVNKTKGNDK